VSNSVSLINAQIGKVHAKTKWSSTIRPIEVGSGPFAGGWIRLSVTADRRILRWVDAAISGEQQPDIRSDMVISRAKMTDISPTSQYALGSTDAEHERLIRQAAWLASHTERLFRDAGIGPGQRVLDIGSGVGDVAILAANVVGPSGEVVGIERDPRSISRARGRINEFGLDNVTFTQSDVSQVPSNKPFDAAVGRYILFFLPDPAAILHSVSQLVRPGGVIAFQEPSWEHFLSMCAPLPLWRKAASVVVETFQRSGAKTDLGPALSRIFQEAGLPAPSTRIDTLLGAEQWMPDVLQSLRPQMTRFNLSADSLGDFDTLSQRLEIEVKASRTTTPLPDLVSAWALRQ
jgi:ubiquinone/menaquinone biosynthesis C-methylase UbiE